MASHRYCDGVQRRDFLKVGALGATGLTLGNYLQLLQASEVKKSAKATAAIFVNLTGGPSHMDSFDLKPDSPSEVRGEFNPIKTNVAGVEFSEHLPRLAKVADKFAILRGVSHTLAAHEFGQKYMTTGNRPLPSLEYPGYGSVVSKELGGEPELPPYVAVPNTKVPSGFLGVEFAPMNTTAAPKADQPFMVRGVSLRNGLTVHDVDRRNKLLEDLDVAFAGYEKSGLLGGMERFSEQAHSIITSTKAREAFDTSKESDSIRKLFKGDDFSQSCLLAGRLVESGVKFVTVTGTGWDTHRQNFDVLKSDRLPKLDAALAGLFTMLSQKGLLEKTIVFVTGEFGRTPKINQNAGRDHWPRAMFCLLAGGGIKTGQVVGASDDKAMGPANDAITPDDVAATFYHQLGIDFLKEYNTNTGRPITIVRNGNPIQKLIG